MRTGSRAFEALFGVLEPVARAVGFEDVGNALAFASSSANPWTGTLSIYQWSGNPSVGGGADRLFFGTDNSALTANQLGQINFYDCGPGSTFLGTGRLLENGELVVVPEPSSVFTALGMLGMAWLRDRKRSRSLRKKTVRMAMAGTMATRS